MNNRLSSQSFRYDLTDPSMREDLLRARHLVQELNRLDVNDTAAKKTRMKELFGTLGDGADLNPPFTCDFGKHIHIGNNFFCNYNCTILDIAEVTIGDDCLFGPNVSIYTAAHPVDFAGRKANIGTGAPVRIGNGVWIGGNSVILGGVTIGDRAVIGAGSVVTHDIPPDTVWAGNPARFLRNIDNGEEKEIL